MFKTKFEVSPKVLIYHDITICVNSKHINYQRALARIIELNALDIDICCYLHVRPIALITIKSKLQSLDLHCFRCRSAIRHYNYVHSWFTMELVYMDSMVCKQSMVGNLFYLDFDILGYGGCHTGLFWYITKIDNRSISVQSS